MKPFQCPGCKMITRSLFASLIIAAIASLVFLGPVSGQTTTEPPSLIVGTVGVRSVIDGVWHVSEWDDAVEARLGVYSEQVNDKGEVYVRLKHDNSSLYVLIDSVSDSGLAWKEDSLNVTGWAMLWFDGNNNGYPLGDKNDFTVIISPWNKGKGNYVQFFRLSDGANFTAQASVADELGASPHSSAGHRVYELSVPMKLITGSTEGTQSKTIGFNISVQDSYQNVLTLSRLGVTLAKLQFTENVLPEHPEVQIPLLLTLTALILHKTRHKTRRSPANVLNGSVMVGDAWIDETIMSRNFAKRAPFCFQPRFLSTEKSRRKAGRCLPRSQNRNGQKQESLSSESWGG